VIFGLLACVCGLAHAAGQQVVLPDGRHLYLNCTGHGSPTVLLEGGFGAASGLWGQVQPVLDRTMQVCSYDRAGYGQSDMGPLPRDGRAVAKDLDQALRRAGIGGPFIMVGHSIGALYVRLFADLRPADVIGMVLVDPSVAHQDIRIAAMFGRNATSNAPLRAEPERCLEAARKNVLPSLNPLLRSCVPGEGNSEPLARQIAGWRTELSELDTMWGATSDEMDSGRYYYGSMPLIVLTADGTYASLPEPARQAVSAFWRKLHDEIAVSSSQGSNRMVSHSSHMMPFDRPDAISDAVKEIVARTRK
jgi:pimeloyl-ACP methyl ester carboxylesterase